MLSMPSNRGKVGQPRRTLPPPTPSKEFLFAKSILDGDITFTRGSVAQFISNDGLYDEAATNEVVFEYDTDNTGLKGLLMERASTNLCLHSEDLTNAAWFKNKSGTAADPIVTGDYAISPDGTQNADRVILDITGRSASTDYCRVGQYITGLANPHDETVSLWLKSNSGDVDVAVAYNAPIEVITVTEEWQKFEFKAIGTTATTGSVQIRLRNSEGTDEYADLCMWGGDFKVQDFHSSYIPTTTASVTRSADVMTADLTAVWDSTANTVLLEFELDEVATNNQYLFYANDASDTTNAIIVYINAGGWLIIQVFNGGSTEVNLNSGATVSAGKHKVALTFSDNSCRFYWNGVSKSHDTTCDVPSDVIDSFFIGMQSNSTNQLDGCISYLALYNRALSTDELEGITTL